MTERMKLLKCLSLQILLKLLCIYFYHHAISDDPRDIIFPENSVYRYPEWLLFTI